jgi:inorganic pyrophosphatase
MNQKAAAGNRSAGPAIDAAMAKPLTKIAHKLDPEALTCRAVIETPAGSRAKYKYNERCRAIELARILPAALSFPLDYGFVPGTLAEDGDAIDILVLSDIPLPAGCLVEVRLVGAVIAEQTEKGGTVRNDRLIARSIESLSYASINSIEELGEPFVRELKRFFVAYNEFRGRRFEVLGVEGPEKAAALIASASAG